MKKCFLFSLFILSTGVVCAQTRILDSIEREIRKHPEQDTTRVRVIMDYVEAAINENTTRLLPYLGELINISKQHNYIPGIQSGYMTAQIYYADRGDFANGMLYADSAFLYLHPDTTSKAMVSAAFLHNNVAGDYMKIGDYQQAIDHYTQAAGILEKFRPDVLPVIYSGMAEVYDRLKQPAKALDYDIKAIAAAEKTGKRSSIARRNMNYAGRLIDQKQFDKAVEILDKMESTVMELQESFLFVFFYKNRGDIFQNKKDYKQAIENFGKAYDYAVRKDDKYEQLAILNSLGACMIEAGLLHQARPVIDTLLAQSLRYQMPFSRLNAYINLANWYHANSNYLSESDMLKKRIALADSIASEDTKEKIGMLETRFKVSQKDKEITQLRVEKELQALNIRQKNTYNIILLGSAVVLLLLTLLTYRNYRQKRKMQQRRIHELETEKQLSATEAVLKGEEQERTRLAKDLHDGLGGMLSGIKYTLTDMKGNLIMTPENARAFERGMDMLDSSIREMRRVAHNMMPEALVRFGLDTALRDFCNDINKSGALEVQYQSIGLENAVIDPTKSVAIYRVVQELLNNAMKHASARNALVQVTFNNSQLAVTVEDDGRGFDPSILVGSRGIGWMNIQNRVEFLKGRWDIDSEPGKGTSVHIEMDIS